MKPQLALSMAVFAVFCIGSQMPGVATSIGDTSKPAGLDAHETHAAVSLLGQVRTNLSSWLWLKSDLYLHNGVEMRPLTERETKTGVQAAAPANDGHEQLHAENEVTIVPPSEKDFRGWFGDLDRATNAYKNMQNHTHNDPMAALPLFRLMTWLDPQFTPGWTTGATIIARDPSKRGTYEALNFLSDGLHANPDSVEILVETGYLNLTRRQDKLVAAEYFEKARSAGRLNVKTLDEDEREAFEQSYRWLALCYRDLGQHDALRGVLSEGLAAFPDDPVLAHTDDTLPLILSEKGQRVWLGRQRQKSAIH